MSARQTTQQIIKERLSVLAVIFSCLALVVVTQEAQRFFSTKPPTPTATRAPATLTSPPASSRPSAEVTPRSTRAAAGPAPTSGGSPTKPVSFSGRWAGSFSEMVNGAPYTYQYLLELSQQGNFMSGKSTIQDEDNPDAFAQFVVRGQIMPGTNQLSVQLAEDLQRVQKLNAGSAIAPRTIRLDYFSAEGQEYLEGEWADRRYTTGSITGTVKLVKQ